jgi:hypothetical protein
MTENCEYCNSNDHVVLVESLGTYYCTSCRKKLIEGAMSTTLQYPLNAVGASPEGVKIERNSRGYNYELKLNTVVISAIETKIEELNAMIARLKEAGE